MGWWELSKDAVLGDDPLDRVGDAAVQVLRDYAKTWKRVPNEAERAALVEAFAKNLQSPLDPFDLPLTLVDVSLVEHPSGEWTWMAPEGLTMYLSSVTYYLQERPRNPVPIEITFADGSSTTRVGGIYASYNQTVRPKRDAQPIRSITVHPDVKAWSVTAHLGIVP